MDLSSSSTKSVYQNSIRGFPGRAKVATFIEAKFWVNEEVYLTENGVLKGPFLVASFDENDRDYTLTEADGVTKWEGGKKVKEESLRRGKN